MARGRGSGRKAQIKGLNHCLVGRWEDCVSSLPSVEVVQEWVKAVWKVEGKVMVYELSRG